MFEPESNTIHTLGKDVIGFVKEVCAVLSNLAEEEAT
jgi:hypothetical protein